MLNVPMRLTLLGPFLLGLGSLAMPAGGTSDAMRLKCRNTTVLKPLYFVDGRTVSEDSAMKLVPADVGFVSVTCLNPTDSTRLAPDTKLPGIPIVAFWSATGPYSLLRLALDSVVAAQTELRARTGSFKRDMQKQPLPALPANIRMSFEATDTGWDATVWIDQALSPRCHVFGGERTTGGTDARTKTFSGQDCR